MRWLWRRHAPPAALPVDAHAAERLDEQRRLWPEIIRLATWARSAAEENRFSDKIAEAYRSPPSPRG